MSIYLAEPRAIQSSPGFAATALVWLGQRIERRRRRAAELHDLRHLRRLDAHLLDDAGVDKADLQRLFPHVTGIGAHLICR